MAAVSILSTAGLSRSFGGIRAVRTVDFSVGEREIRGIIGPNGAGKTTFVSLLSGRLRTDAGAVRFRERDITAMPAWRRVRLGIAYTFQITSIYPALPVYDNIAIGAQVRAQGAVPAGQVASRIDAITSGCLEQTGLAPYRSHLAGELSYGHQRLLELAMGLALDPVLLILDEPTQGLSDGEIGAFTDLLRRIREHKTIILIEHNLPVVLGLADRITVMDQGTVLAEGTPGEIQNDPAVQAAYLGG